MGVGLRDSAAYLKYAYGVIKSIEDNNPIEGQTATLNHRCKYVKAADAEAIVGKHLGDQKQEVTFKNKEGVTRTRVRVHNITVDPMTNSIMITGPADKIAKAKEILDKIDVPQHPNQPPIVIGPPAFMRHEVPTGNAEVLAKAMQMTFKPTPTMNITALGNNALLVFATPEDQRAIAKYLSDIVQPATTSTDVIGLSTLESTKALETLKGMFPPPKDGAGALYLDADANRNAIIVRGTPQMVKEVREAIKVLEGPGQVIGSGGGINMRSFTLKEGSAAALAAEIQRLLKEMRPGADIQLIRPSSGLPEKKPAEPEPPVRPRKLDTSFQEGEPQKPAAGKEKPQLSDPRAQQPKGKSQPVTIAAFGNRLIVTSDDPKALALVQELVRLYTDTTAGEGDFELPRCTSP